MILGQYIKFLHKSLRQERFDDSKAQAEKGRRIHDKDAGEHLGIIILTVARILGIAIDRVAMVEAHVVLVQIDESNALGEAARPTRDAVEDLKHPFQKVPKWPFWIGNGCQLCLMNGGELNVEDDTPIGIGVGKDHGIGIAAFEKGSSDGIGSRGWKPSKVVVVEFQSVAVFQKRSSSRQGFLDRMMGQEEAQKPESIVLYGIIEGVSGKSFFELRNICVVFLNEITSSRAIVVWRREGKRFGSRSVFVDPDSCFWSRLSQYVGNGLYSQNLGRTHGTLASTAATRHGIY